MAISKAQREVEKEIQADFSAKAQADFPELKNTHKHRGNKF